MKFLNHLCHLENKRIVLASQSPRRQEMLRAGGLDFEVVPAQTPENPLHYRDEILTRYGDIGLRGLLHAHAEEVLEVEVPSPEVLEDMDEPGDYARAQTRFPTSR